MTVAQQYRIDRSLPAMEARKLVPEGIRAEVIDDVLYVSSSPTPYHAIVCMDLLREILNYVHLNQLGRVFNCPVDLYLEGEKSVVIPDLIFIARHNPLIFDRKGLIGVPDLLVEILSPSTRKRDLTIKKSLYERTRVKEYWVINPDTRDAHGYLLEDKLYGNALQLNSEIHVRILDKTFKF